MAILRQMGDKESIAILGEIAYTYIWNMDKKGRTTTYEISYNIKRKDGHFNAEVKNCGDGNSDVSALALYFQDGEAYVYLPDMVSVMGKYIYEGSVDHEKSIYTYEPTNVPRGPSVIEAAEMAEHIYKHDTSSRQEDRTISGWRLIDVYSEGSLKIGVYIKDGDDWKNPSEYCIVNRGTTDSEGSGNDWDDNLLQPIGGSGDMKLSIDYAKWFAENHSDKKITFIGHSKGGGEAMAMAVATNNDCITFNPAKANLKVYDGTKNKIDSYTGTMTHYIVEGEILNHLFGNPSTGTTVKLRTQVPIESGSVNAWGQRIDNHHMWAVKEALKEAGY